MLDVLIIQASDPNIEILGIWNYRTLYGKNF